MSGAPQSPARVEIDQALPELPEHYATICDDGYWLSNKKGPIGHNHIPAGWPSKRVFIADQVYAYATEVRAAERAEVVRLREALTQVADWRLPPTGEVWPSGAPVSFESNNGSVGVMNYFRAIARAALATTTRGEQG